MNSRKRRRRPLRPARHGGSRPMRVECLESRSLLAAIVTATLTDNSSGGVAPGATINYTEIISNTAAIGAGNDALNLQNSQALDPNTTLVLDSLNISTRAFDDTFSAVGNTQLVLGGAAAVAAPPGEIASVQVTSGGGDYTSMPAVTFTGGGGAVLTDRRWAPLIPLSSPTAAPATHLRRRWR